MFIRFLKSTLFFLLAFGLSAHSTTVDLRHVSYIKHNTKRDTLSAVSKKESNSIFELLFEQITATQTNNQNYKPAYSARLASITDQHTLAYTYPLKHLFSSGVIGFSRFCKLILFPFHVFW